MAHKKGQGSSRNGRDSNAQRLGCKKFAGETVTGGSILVRQRGTPLKPGKNVGRAKDDSLYAKIDGKVDYHDKGRLGRFISVTALTTLTAAAAVTAVAAVAAVAAVTVAEPPTSS